MIRRCGLGVRSQRWFWAQGFEYLETVVQPLLINLWNSTGAKGEPDELSTQAGRPMLLDDVSVGD